MAHSRKLEFEGSQGAQLAARLDLPAGQPRAYAIFAHCFTCSKDLHASRRISEALSALGIAVLRFDFTGLGRSGGDFASTNFSSNQHDLLVAADYLREHFKAPSLLIGHSLGGAAVLSVAGQIPEVDAVVTIGAPAMAEHVAHNFGAKLDKIEQTGEAEVNLAGRKFSVRKQFLDDLKANDVLSKVAMLRKPLLLLHSPIDNTVGVENATEIFVAAKHPKSFISLDNADHLLTGREDAEYVASVIAAWSERYLEPGNLEENSDIDESVTVEETGAGKFQNRVTVGPHTFLSDEPVQLGGLGSGPTPYDLLASALGTCTAMTLRMYSDFKKLDIGRVSVKVGHKKVHAQDCVECAEELAEKGGKIDVFERRISVEGLDDKELEAKLLSIADRCPVHRTLEKGAAVKTVYENGR